MGYSLKILFLARQFELTEPMGPYKPSSLIDFMEGKPVEVEAIWGEALRRGKAQGGGLCQNLQNYSLSLGKFAFKSFPPFFSCFGSRKDPRHYFDK